MYVHRVRADQVDPERHLYVNRPGKTPYPFTIHKVRPLPDGRVRIEFGGTHVACKPDFKVLVTDVDEA
ncbi:hypothetical protein [Saccharopolyspora pogona]|uniref:hypothetical protein n=1 Tax=Saccharopolyspora pogona TaxID=333966 RepID=UPI001CC220C5|nr:hypothetical protein [Saccharopolyspora pogona]